MAKILVADDNSNIQKMVGLALKDQGIDVVAVGNGEAAVRKVSDIKPDLVLADVFMPVRNGYEVCRYVKEDPALAHIPVILLVGAFDPLDEQEAQRVGADGVLKKPFVPPDPLISMVKSALARAGVSLGHAPAEKVAEPAKRSAADILSPAASKLAALSAEKPAPAPTVPAEAEDFPLTHTVEAVKIAAGSEPLAFGSLLETEDEAQFMPSKPPTEIGSTKTWSATHGEEEEQVESKGGWRPGTALEDADEDVAVAPSKVPDWREAAFHGNSPAAASRNARWTPSAVIEAPAAEAAEATSVAVSTLEPKVSEAPAPFSGDAWAAAMAAGVEDKLATLPEPASEAIPATSVATESPVVVAPSLDAAVAEVKSEATVAEPAALEAPAPSSWFSISSSPWETEAKKASALASTWDAPIAPEPELKPVAAVEEAPAPLELAETPHVQETVEEAVEEQTTADVTEQESAAVTAPVPVEEFTAAEASSSEVSAYVQSPVEAEADIHEFAQQAAAEVETAAEPHYVAETSLNETQEVEPYEQPAEAASAYAGEPLQSEEEPLVADAEISEPATISALVESIESTLAQDLPPVEASNEIPAVAHDAEESATAPVEPEAPAMAHVDAAETDELVNRVLQKLNPDVLQRLTKEILKPVVEALIHDELTRKKIL